VLHSRAERVKIFPLLKQVGRYQDEWIARHPELSYEGLVDLPGHPTDRLLLPQQ
jgi:hypothetical protein